MKRLAFVVALLLLGAFVYGGYGGGVVSADGIKTIFAKALTDHECDSTDWHFVINQISEEGLAPSTIHVSWANGASADVPMWKFTGGVAHYVTTANLNSTVVEATAQIYEAWDGQFNLSHGPCPPLPPQPAPCNQAPTAAGCQEGLAVYDGLCRNPQCPTQVSCQCPPPPPTQVPPTQTVVPTPTVVPTATATPKPKETLEIFAGKWQGEYSNRVPEGGICFETGTAQTCTDASGWAKVLILETKPGVYTVVLKGVRVHEVRVFVHEKNKDGKWYTFAPNTVVRVDIPGGSNSTWYVECFNPTVVPTPTITPAVPTPTPAVPAVLPKAGDALPYDLALVILAIAIAAIFAGSTIRRRVKGQ